MQSIRPFASLLSTVLLLAACQTTPLQQPQGAQMAQSLALNTALNPVLNATETESNPVFQGHFEVRANGSTSQISFVPKQSGGFSTQALRRSDIKKYRMTVSWPGNSTGLSADLDADATGVLTGPITVSNVPGGDFRTIILEALDAGGTAMPDLTAGHVYNFSGTVTQNANSLITRSGHAVAKTIRHFANSTVAGDRTIFDVWKANPAGTLTDLNALVTTVLTGKDPMALDPAKLIAAIQTKADGSMPVSGNVNTSTAGNVTLTYSVPAGFVLPEGTRLSLDMASSEAIVIPAPQAAGTHTVIIPNVYLPLGAASTPRRLRFFAATDTNYATPFYNTSASVSLNNTGFETVGSSANPLPIPADILTALATSSTFYVNASGGDDAQAGSEALPWKTLAFAIAQIKTKTLAGSFGSATPVLVVETGTYAENNLTVDFPIQILGKTNVSITGTGGTAFNLGQDSNSAYTTSATQRISLSNLAMTGFTTSAINVSSTVSHLTLSGISATNGAGGIGFKVPVTVSVSDLIMNNSSFTGYRIGLAVLSDVNETSYFSDVVIKSSTFSNNTQKGVFIEKANNVSFDDITIDHSGTDVADNGNGGFMLYLRGGSNFASSKAYSNISLTNSKITDSAYQGTAIFPGAYARAAVLIGIREAGDNNYATLNNVTIKGNTISGPMQALRIASPDSSVGVTSPEISGVVFEDNKLALETNNSYDPTKNRFFIINHTKGGINAATGNTFDGVNPATATDAQAFAIEDKILDQLDYNVYQSNAFVSGRVKTGLMPTTRMLVPFREDGANIQPAIDAAQTGDTVTLQEGVYNMNGRTLTLNKDITLQGQSINTVLQQAHAVGSDRLMNITAAGASLRNMHIEKTNKAGAHNLIQVTAGDVTLEDLKITGLWASSDGDVSRAFEIAGGLSGLLIQNNEIGNLRQPAYINSNTTGTISGNRVYGTKGWVIDGARMTFSSTNTWRSDGQATSLATPSENIACDVALFNQSPVNTGYNSFYGAIASLEDSLGDLLPVGTGMATCDQRVLP